MKVSNLEGKINTYFSNSIDEATCKFVASCNQAGGHVELVEHPLKGPDGGAIHTAVGWLGDKAAKKIALFITGTHGIEGYAGSGVMVGALLSGGFDELPKDTAVMLIHMINPWGCAWGHRHTENNADLFRDLIYYKPDLFCDDHEFNETFRLASTPKCWSGKEKERSDTALSLILKKQGVDEMIRIARVGQHKFPDSQCYNGDGSSWSTRLYRRLCEKYLCQAKHVFCVDYHTGFGDFGKGICIPYCQSNESGGRKLQRLIDAFGEEKIFQAGFDPTIPTHPRAPWETVEDFIPGLEMTCTGLEFGTYTYDLDTVIEINRYMNYLLVYGDLSQPERRDLYDLYQTLYYPNTAEWNESIYRCGSDIALKTVKYLRGF